LTTKLLSNETYDGNWDVPYINQTSDSEVGKSACGPTSIAMLLRFFYPNSKIGIKEVYHAGIENYTYNSGPADAYRNVGWLNGDVKVWQAPAEGRSSYRFDPDNGGMVGTRAIDYLQHIWGIETREVRTIDGVYAAIQQGPLLAHVYGDGVVKSSYKHIIVIRGIETKDGDDYIIVNDPNTWSGISGQNRKVRYEEFFQKWLYNFRGGRTVYRLIPNSYETAEKRKYTVVVDTGHNTFGSGNYHYHSFQLDNPADWKFYYGGDGDWYYSDFPNRAARWTPALSSPGNYQVSVKFRGDADSGKVTYTIYSKTGAPRRTVQINQYKARRTWDYAVLADSIILENGDYVRASNIPAGTNVDAVKFKFLSPPSGSPSGYSKTSTRSFSSSGGQQTLHTFSLPASTVIADNGTLKIGLRGDFNGRSEYATVFVEGVSIGQHNGGRQCSSGYDYKSFTLSKSQLEGFAADGKIAVVIKNSSAVNYCGNGQRYHEVRLEFPTDNSPPPSGGTYNDTNTRSFSRSGSQKTLHTFSLPASTVVADNGTLKIGLRGDFNSRSEYATVFVEGEYIGQHNGGRQCSSSYDYKTFPLSESRLERFAADGKIEVTIKNSSAVNHCSDGQRYHKVELTFSTQ